MLKIENKVIYIILIAFNMMILFYNDFLCINPKQVNSYCRSAGFFESNTTTFLIIKHAYSKKYAHRDIKP